MTTFMTSPFRAPRVTGRPGRGMLHGLCLGALAAVTLGLSATNAAGQFTQGQIPITGPVPVSPSEVNTFDSLDAAITQLMEDHQVSATTVGILRNDRIIYQRGFGWKDYDGGDLTPIMPETRMRVASVSKPFTAVAIHHLVASGALSLSDKVFAYGQPPGVGILPATPFGPYTGTLPDTGFHDITVEDLLLHRSGIAPSWDPMFSAIFIANELGIPSPPSRVELVQWLMSKTLDYPVGAWPSGGTHTYSNIGYMLLGLVVEEASGMDQLDYLHANVLADWGGSPDELQHGRSFRADQHPSEPYYDSHGVMVDNVYEPSELTEEAYGGWNHEALAGAGGLISNTTQVLQYLDRYWAYTDYSDPGGKSIGSALPGGLAPWGGWAHHGSLPGTHAVAHQEGDRAVAIFANQRNSSCCGSDFTAAVLLAVQDWFASSNPWPSTYATDNWGDFDTGSGNGSFSLPENNVEHLLQLAQTGGTVKIKPSTTDWTGTINQAVVLSAPLGPATIGLD